MYMCYAILSYVMLYKLSIINDGKWENLLASLVKKVKNKIIKINRLFKLEF